MKFDLRSLLMLAASALSALMVSPAFAGDYKVFLLGGQSNMRGFGVPSGLPTSPVNLQQAQSDVLFYEGGSLRDLAPGTQFGPEITFGREMADALPDENIVLIKYAVGGTSLDVDWDPNTGPVYDAFTDTVANGLAALIGPGDTYEIAGMLWTQGERDANNDRTTAQYESDLTEFVGAIRADYGADLPFFLSRLSNRQRSASNAARWEAIRTAQTQFAADDANAYLIDTDGTAFSVIPTGIIHFDTNGQIALGQAFADSYLQHIPEPNSLMLLGAGGLFLLRRFRGRAD
ncbi:MAG: sialate O-acetylesterase [Planctomycetota bacterium]